MDLNEKLDVLNVYKKILDSNIVRTKGSLGEVEETVVREVKEFISSRIACVFSDEPQNREPDFNKEEVVILKLVAKTFNKKISSTPKKFETIKNAAVTIKPQKVKNQQSPVVKALGIHQELINKGVDVNDGLALKEALKEIENDQAQSQKTN